MRGQRILVRMEHTTPPSAVRKEERAIRIALITLSIITVMLLVFLIRDYRIMHRPQFSRMHPPLTASDVNVIQSWMTFDYVNHIFALPPDMLKTALSITDPRYPRMPVATLLQRTKDAVQAYLSSTLKQ
jgi:hypothetical protein